jgi:hypothetical protein
MPYLDTLHVNIYAVRGQNTSVLASALRIHLERAGVTVGQVADYVEELQTKDMLWGTEQFSITAEQYQRETIFQGKVDVVIVSSPIALGVAVASIHYKEALALIARKLTENWKTINVLFMPNGASVCEVPIDSGYLCQIDSPVALTGIVASWSGMPCLTLLHEDGSSEAIALKVLSRLGKLKSTIA